MRLSKRCEYGIKASVCLAQRRERAYVQSRELAEAEALPAKFLESILLAMRSAGLLESKVGAGGGYRLARPAEQIMVAEIIAALLIPEEPSAESRAAAPESPRYGQLAADIVQDRIEEMLDQAFGSLTLAELVSQSEERTVAQRSAMYHI